LAEFQSTAPREKPGSTSLRSSTRIDFALRRRLPSMFVGKEWVREGGLMSYGDLLPERYHRAAHFVDKILKGAKPADLPVEQPTKFELAVNVKTAKAIGLTIPEAFLARADEVIE
jgi:putative ABC transport system substrate-binding protein